MPKEYYNSLSEMLHKYFKTHDDGNENKTIPASLTYPASKDNYNKENKVPIDEVGFWNENDFGGTIQ